MCSDVGVCKAVWTPRKSLHWKLMLGLWETNPLSLGRIKPASVLCLAWLFGLMLHQLSYPAPGWTFLLLFLIYFLSCQKTTCSSTKHGEWAVGGFELFEISQWPVEESLTTESDRSQGVTIPGMRQWFWLPHPWGHMSRSGYSVLVQVGRLTHLTSLLIREKEKDWLKLVWCVVLKL